MSVRVGEFGKAVTSLHPQGYVEIRGRRYDARAMFGPIEPDSEIIVIKGDHLGLVVRQVEANDMVQPMPSYGPRAFTSFGERIADETIQAAEARRQWQSSRQRYGWIVGTVLGLVFFSVGIWVRWEYLVANYEETWLTALVVAGLGAVWGGAIFRMFDDALQQLDESFHPITFFCAPLGLAGTVIGLAWGVPALGWVAGVFAAVVATIVLGVLPLVFIILTMEL